MLSHNNMSNMTTKANAAGPRQLIIVSAAAMPSEKLPRYKEPSGEHNRMGKKATDRYQVPLSSHNAQFHTRVQHSVLAGQQPSNIKSQLAC